MQIERHDHHSLYVTDLERSSRWLQEVLGMTPRNADVWWSETARFFGSGEAMIALFQRSPEASYSSQGMPIGNHHALRVNRESFEAFKEHLRQKGIAFRRMNHTLSESIYFQDPDDYWFELTTYEGVS